MMNAICQSLTESHVRHPRGARFHAILCAAMMLGAAASSDAAFLLEIDTDGADDGVVTYNSHFSFGGDTTTASQSVTSTAFGTTGGDSIFGGDGVVFPDTYVFTYQPSVDGDNLVIPIGTDLGNGNTASGMVGGGAGTYRVYATWPSTSNVSGGATRYTLSTAGTTDVIVDIDQNIGGGSWVLLGDIDYSDLSSTILVTQVPTVTNSFVSMRAYGLLFELVEQGGAVPVPGTLALLAIGIAGYRRRPRAA